MNDMIRFATSTTVNNEQREIESEYKKLLNFFLEDIDYVSSNVEKQGCSNFSNTEWVRFLEWSLKIDDEKLYVSVYDELKKHSFKVRKKYKQYNELNPIPDNILYYYKIILTEKILQEMISITEHKKEFEKATENLTQNANGQSDNILLKSRYQYLLEKIAKNENIQSKQLELKSKKENGMSRASFYNSIKVLCDKKLIKCTKVGKNSFYSITNQGKDTYRYVVGKKIGKKFDRTVQENMIRSKGDDLKYGDKTIDIIFK